MRTSNRRLRVFVASPGDVAEERDLVSHVVGEIRRMFQELLPVELETVRWETHAWPDVGEDAQDVINQEIGEYDIFVGVMWRRFGTPTKRARSGTDEEFQRAYGYFRKYNRPKVMFYFRTTEFYTTDLHELAQFKKVVQFRKELEQRGVLFWQYSSPLEFERGLREHLVRQVMGFVRPARPTRSGPSVLPPPAGPKGPSRKPGAPSAGSAPSIFLAYSHEDRQLVSQVYESLRLAGLNPWLDTQNLVPGQLWRDVVADEIQKAEVILLFLSKRSITRKGYFQKELRIALDIAARAEKGVGAIVPVRLDQVELPMEVAQYQSIDCFVPSGMERLITILKKRSRQ